MTRGYAAIGLDRVKDPHNMGGVLRAAHCFGAALVVVGGSRLQRAAADTTKAWRHMPVIAQVEGAAMLDVVPYSCVPVAVELIDGAEPLPGFKHPERAFYIFGPEDGCVSNGLLLRCRHFVQVPTRFCLNLAAAVNVVLYDRAAKASRQPQAAEAA